MDPDNIWVTGGGGGSYAYRTVQGLPPIEGRRRPPRRHLAAQQPVPALDHVPAAGGMASADRGRRRHLAKQHRPGRLRPQQRDLQAGRLRAGRPDGPLRLHPAPVRHAERQQPA
ncbi:hypothetical protein G6F35_017766 [Rhizopus arrhizus]|nr:hypothetical protein G6F35_017766 [Rhizopus arrhizus]